ncbi:MAG: ABC transporter permease [Synergistaceae bacterium]|jgi:simple sugar transport system permease protein|nr:ABC transporter permease [Synergistaceae bacterium]
MLKKFIEAAGWPRIIIGLFLMSLFLAAPFVGVRISTSLSDTLVRFGMNGVMVLAMIPMVQAGCGLNFGLPLGVIAGLLGATMSIEFDVRGAAGFAVALALSIPIAAVLGYGYGQLLNRVKGDEMMIATYVGFSSVAFMCMAWLLLPYRNATMVWGYQGTGLRTTISVDGYWFHILSDFLSFKIGTFYFPTGMFLFFGVMSFLMWLFMKTKTGTAMTAVGANPEFARASGVDVDRMRVVSVVLSTVVGAVGILVYEQSFGFIQLYMGPFYMALPAVAALLLGGASVRKATIFNVVVGTFLFQGILTMTPSVINSVLKTDMSEVIRIIVSNGMILYALTRKAQVRR